VLAPATLAELGTVSGVGETKLARYGQLVLAKLGAAAAAAPGAAAADPEFGHNGSTGARGG